MGKYRDILRDIVEISYMPPIRDHLPILDKGGYHYREGNINFDKLKNKIKYNGEEKI